MGRIDSARPLLEESLKTWQQLGDERGVATALNSLAWAAFERNDYGRARRSGRRLARAQEPLEAVATPVPPRQRERIERLHASVRERTGESHGRLAAEGRKMKVNEAVALAFETLG